jgi:hypothetical protein
MRQVGRRAIHPWVLQLFGDRAVEVKSSAKFEAGVPKALFETRLGHLADQCLDVFPQTGPSHWPGLPPPEQTESFAMPSDQCLRLNDNQSVAPVEPLAQEAHQPASGILGATRSEIALL